MEFDAGFYQRYYVDAATRVASRADSLRLGRMICAWTDYLGFRVHRVLDAGCGLGQMRVPVRQFFPRASYTGLEVSEYLCRRHGWVRGSLADYRPRAPFDCDRHDVLHCRRTRDVRALMNSAGVAGPVLQRADPRRRNADRSRTDSAVGCGRPTGTGSAWRSFRPLAAGCWPEWLCAAPVGSGRPGPPDRPVPGRIVPKPEICSTIPGSTTRPGLAARIGEFSTPFLKLTGLRAPECRCGNRGAGCLQWRRWQLE